MIEIKNRWDGSIIYSADVESMRLALKKAVRDGASLDGADLARASLDGAGLARANLDGASLDGANLRGANLCGASLCGASLDGADLARANLVGANLVGASLDGANLCGASLDGADLARANLDGASLDGARNFNLNLWLKPVRDDIRAVLDTSPHEVPGLLAKLWAGEVDGTAYEGECACLVGSIAKVRGCAYNAIPGLKPDSGRPAERWFYRILKGHTPLNSPSAAYAAAVIAHWQHERASAKPKRSKRAALPIGETR